MITYVNSEKFHYTEFLKTSKEKYVFKLLKEKSIARKVIREDQCEEGFRMYSS